MEWARQLAGVKATRIEAFGDSDALETGDIERPEPRSEQVLLEVRAAGINFADIMQRRGEYPGGPQPPFTPGMEVAGVVSEVGDEADLDEGDRVVGLVGQGGYGIKTSPALSRVCASLIAGGGMPDDVARQGVSLEDLTPQRLRESQSRQIAS